MTLGGKSIRTVAPQRALDDPTFSTPPGSPFQGEPLDADPLMEPTCRRGEKDGLLSAVLIEKFYA